MQRVMIQCECEGEVVCRWWGVVSEIYLQLARLSLLSANVSLFLSLHANGPTPALCMCTRANTHRFHTLNCYALKSVCVTV